MANYIAELRRLAEHCDYSSFLDEMLQDRLVCGVGEEAVQRCLLTETDLTFAKAQDLAIAAEYAKKRTQEMRDLHSPEAAEVCYIDRNISHKAPNSSSMQGKNPGKVKTPPSSVGKCWRCGGTHNMGNCHFAHAVCHFCGKKGHIVRACRQKMAK